MPPYQQVRRQALNGRIHPSTSIAQQALLLPGADMNIQALGVIPQNDPALVSELLAALGATGDEAVPIQTGGRVALREALSGLSEAITYYYFTHGEQRVS